MPRIPRSLLVESSEVGVYHCISRCVRRAFLCGDDRLSGRNFDHRRQWIQNRLRFLAGEFGIDVLGFAVMSNHLHVVLRNRPDVVRGWSDDEVARRWWNLFPLRRDDDGRPAEPQEWELSMITGNPERLAEVRSRLSNLSWFMRCVAEPIARQANREDDCTGRFWEGRFKCQPILDESALAACLVYVDLNPIRAQLADTPETSRFTSIYERIRALQTPRPATSTAHGAALAQYADAGPGGVAECSQPAHGEVAWLSPLELGEASPDSAVSRQRASNSGCLPMSFADYLRLVEWTGRQVRSGKAGSISPELAPILERLTVPGDAWLPLVSQFSRLFRRSAGRPASIRRDALHWGRRRFSGIGASQALFGTVDRTC